jgi:DNA replication protein DnaC
MSARPQMPKFSDGKAAWETYEATLAEWEKSTEGIAEAAAMAEQREREAAAARAAYENNLKANAAKLVADLGLPPRALEAAFLSLDDTDATASARNCRDMLVLSGRAGCGKTVAAVAWVLAFVNDPGSWAAESHSERLARFRPRKPVWVTAARLARWERYDEDKMGELLKTPRLVVDDLGGEYMDKGGFYASLLDEIVNERQAASRPTIFTTNLDAEAFKSRYGDRIVDRIREGGRFVACSGASLRRKSA